ncbi:MAG TPA: GDSL-type esterase/lipase family protein [Bacteroidales bacterium]|jgi:acetyl esterase/lipase/lysophospholipase L1-like esterase|nr:GDSL-type esterase/lipase family protein [Bacteroidales bacterium]HQQ81023.1 GDSL-type esterase/lipase family protein [Bacteroidales bacterium]
MNKTRIFYLLTSLTICVLSCSGIQAQVKVIPLEQSLPSGFINPNLEETIIDTNPAKRIVYNVVKPSLLYYPAKNNTSGTCVIIAPGGALQLLSIDNEGVDVAAYLNNNGVDAFVLKYSLVPTIDNVYTELQDNFFTTEAKRDSMISTIIPYAMKDGLAAISYVRKNAAEYGLNPNRIGFMGFSAGGTVALSVVFNSTSENRPNFLATIYPWIGELGGNVPKEKTPAFLVVANDDHLELVPQSMKIYSKWKEADQPVEFHLYGRGGHGFGADKNYSPTDAWLSAFVNWLGGEGLLWPEQPQGYLARMTYKDMLRMQTRQAETTKTDWGNLGRYFKENQEFAEKNTDQAVVFYGNSITENWKRFDNNFFEANQFIGRGIGGQTTSQMLVRFRQDVVNLNPAAVVILAGTNDIAENTGPISVENIAGNIISMAEIAQANGIKPILCAVLPVYQYSWNKAVEPVGKIQLLNQLLKEYAKEKNLSFVDFYTPFVDEHGGLPEKYSSDGVHPNMEGYKIMEQLVGEQLMMEKIRNQIF